MPIKTATLALRYGDILKNAQLFFIIQNGCSVLNVAAIQGFMVRFMYAS